MCCVVETFTISIIPQAILEIKQKIGLETIQEL